MNDKRNQSSPVPGNPAAGKQRADLLRERLRNGLPMPLWLQGSFELLQAAVFSAFLVVIPVIAVWFAGGILDTPIEEMFKLCGQIWLLIHGVPLGLQLNGSEAAPEPVAGVFSLIPLGLTLIPFFMAWRAGRRIARASYTDQLWQGIAGALGVYVLFGLFTGFAVQTETVSISLGAAAIIPLLVAGTGVIVGCRREAGSWGRLIGFDAVAWIAKTSQHSRWAGSYVWAVVRSGTMAYVMSFGLAAAVLAVNLGIHWLDISNVYQQLRPGLIGSAVLTIGQLGMMPNLALWTLSWISGGGIVLGTGSSLSPLETTVGPLPAVPFLGALPTGELNYAWAFMLLPVLAGIVAGWFFLRVGENHFDDWLSLKVKQRWLSLGVSTLMLGVVVGAVAALISLLGSWLAAGSLGIGRFTEMGPEMWPTAAMLGAEVAVGTAIGYLLGPLLEHDPVLDG